MMTSAAQLRKRPEGGWSVAVDGQTIGWVVRSHLINGWRAYTWLSHWTAGVQLADGDGATRAQSVAAVVRRHEERKRTGW